jgi:purine-binding chemotaxis protein CheW
MSERADPDAATADGDGEGGATDGPTDDDDLDERIEETLSDLDVSSTADIGGDEGGTDAPPTPGSAERNGERDTEGAEEAETASVLEFVLGEGRYCLDISTIEQIVERGSVTRIPNAPDFVEGVIDLRGDITTVIDPMETLAADRESEGDLIVVFDSDSMDDDWSVGWAVDGVRRVSTVSLAAVKESPVDEPWINGVVKRDADGQFVIWTEPGELMRAE